MGVIGYPLPPPSLLVVPFHCGGCVLRGNEWIALIPELHFLAGLVADFRQLPRRLLDAPSPVDRCHAPGEVRRAPVGSVAVTGARRAGERAGIVRPYLVGAMAVLAWTGLRLFSDVDMRSG